MSILANTLLLEKDLYILFKSGINDAIAIGSLFGSQRPTVNLNVSAPGLRTARAGLSHLSSALW